jgi:hypothetical protein
MKTNIINTARAAVGAVLFTSIASAATTISIKSVEQRWPWNNKVDITYKVTGGQDVAQSKFYRIVFTTVIDGTTYTIDGNSIGASANDDEHTVTWTAPDGVRCAYCTMSAAIYDSDVPSGSDYMIIDLATGGITYEGLFATQSASDARYNTDTYKTAKLVLRKVPAGGPYRLLSDTTKTTDRDYYIGVFPLTQGQYARVGGDRVRSDIAISTDKMTPMNWISCNDLRLSTTATTSSIPTVATADTGTFFQRLNYKTGNTLSFDLPTLAMFMIAARAGVTTEYFWDSDTMDESKVVCKGNEGKLEDVGARSANNWGLFDVNGNVFEWGLDSDWGVSDFNNSQSFKKLTNIFVPKCDGTAIRTWLGGGGYNMASAGNWFKLRYASSGESNPGSDRGFRVSVIMD